MQQTQAAILKLRDWKKTYQRAHRVEGTFFLASVFISEDIESICLCLYDINDDLGYDLTLDRSEICHLCSKNASLLLPENRKLLYDFLINSLKFVTRNHQKSLVLAQGKHSTEKELQNIESKPSSAIPSLAHLRQSVRSSHVIGLIVLNRFNIMQKNPWRIIRWSSTQDPTRTLPSIELVSKISHGAVKLKNTSVLKSILPESYKTCIIERRQYIDLLRGDADGNKKHTQNMLNVREHNQNCSFRKKEHIREKRSARICELRERCLIRKREREAAITANNELAQRRERNIDRKKMRRNRLYKQSIDAYLRELRRNRKVKASSIRHAHEVMTEYRIHSVMEHRAARRHDADDGNARGVMNTLKSLAKYDGTPSKDPSVSSNIEPTKQSPTLPSKSQPDKEDSLLKTCSSELIPLIVRILPQLRL